MNTTFANIGRRLSFALVVVAIQAASPAIARQANHATEVIPLIQMQDVLLTDAIENLAKVAALNYILDPQVSGSFIGVGGGNKPMPIINLRWENMTAAQALARLLAEQKLMLITNPVTTVSRIVYTNQNVKPVAANQLGTDTNQILPLIRMEETPFPAAIDNLAREAKFNVAIDTKLDNPSHNPAHKAISRIMISFRWQNITAKQALVALLDNYDLMMTPGPNSDTVTITAKTPAEAAQPGK